MPPIIVIFGITGDLAKRYLLPALYQLIKDGSLDEQAQIIGVTRQDLNAEQLLENVDVCVHEPQGVCDPAALHKLHQQIRLFQMDPTDPLAYTALLHVMNQIEDEKGICMNRLYYLSIPPQLYRPIIKLMGEQGLNASCQHGTATSRIIVEKPFGYDLISAQELIDETASVFDEEQIFRVDHFLAKQSVQDILQFRLDNPSLELIWNNAHVAGIDIMASEQIGIEGRAHFYDALGALRDFIQNHLLQLLSIMTMEQPSALNSHHLHAAKQEVLEAVLPPARDKLATTTHRGQYVGYREEAGNPRSTTETYADLTLFIDQKRWQGVPFRLWTGKALAEKKYEIILRLKESEGATGGHIRFRIQPDPVIESNLSPTHIRKVPALKTTSVSDHSPAPRQAYEQVLLDATRGDHTLFVTSGEVLASWHIIQPVLDEWAKNGDDLEIYQPGTAGPLRETAD